MIRLQSPKAVGPLALALLLAACGGGSGGDGASSTQASTSPSNNSGNTGSAQPSPPSNPSPGTSVGSISLFLAAGDVVSYSSSGDAVVDALAYTNYRRQTLGLPVFQNHSGIAQAAANHANYMMLNNTLAHNEISGQAGFTGVKPYDRVNQYYSTSSTGEVVANYGTTGSSFTSDRMIKNLFDAPFHRATMLMDFAKAGAGYAHSDLSAPGWKYHFLGMDMADLKNYMPDNKLLAYPYSGQQGVPTSWANYETPNPMPGYEGQTVGYPVTVQASNNGGIDISQFSIADSMGTNIPCNMIDRNVMAEASRVAMCTPYAALKPNTTYTVQLVGQLERSGKKTSFNISWSFTTGA